MELEQYFEPSNPIFTANAPNCIGATSCGITVSAISDKYVFIKARCKNTEVIFDIDGEKVEVRKTYVVLVAAVFDFAAILTFAIGIAL